MNSPHFAPARHQDGVGSVERAAAALREAEDLARGELRACQAAAEDPVGWTWGLVGESRGSAHVSPTLLFYLTAKTDRFLMVLKESILTPQGCLGGIRTESRGINISVGVSLLQAARKPPSLKDSLDFVRIP